jgi:regulator of cell morphogenesis and NO signaling
MTAQNGTTIRDMVVGNFRTAAVFQKYGIDFCCRGDRPLAEACAEKGIGLAEVLADLDTIDGNSSDVMPRFETWDLDLLVDYIVSNHHQYVKRILPVLYQHTGKVAAVHGANHPEMVQVAASFAKIGQELELHMRKEEQVLFPYIKSLVAAQRAGMTPAMPHFGTVRNPIAMMEAEHRAAGDETAIIRELTHDYTPPEDGCTTYRVTLQELHDFEQDLHRHVHLENNILFPKALELERALMHNPVAEPAACNVNGCSIA